MSKSIAQSVAKNFSLGMVQQLTTWTATFVLMMFLPRYLGSVAYGHIFLASSLAGIFLMFVDYDGRPSIAKMVARDGEQLSQILVNSLGFRVVFWVLAFAGVNLFAYVSGYSASVRLLIAVFGLELSWRGATTVIGGVFQGLEDFRFNVIGAIAERSFVSIAGVIVLLLGAGAFTMSLVMVTGTLLNFLILFFRIRKVTGTLPAVRWPDSKRMIRRGLPYFLFSLFGVIYYRIDSVMLSLMTPEAVVGWYGAAYRFFDLLTFLPAIFSGAVLPVLARLWRDNPDVHRMTLQKGAVFMLLAAIPVTILVIQFARPITSVVYGLKEFSPTVEVLQFLSVGVLFLYLDLMLGTTLLASDKQRSLSILAFCAIPVNIGLNWYLIPYAQVTYGNGGIGAAIATVLTEMGIMSVVLRLMPEGSFKGFRYSAIAKGILAGILTEGALLLVPNALAPWFVLAVAGGALYLALLFLFKTFDAMELEFMATFVSLDRVKNFLHIKKSQEVR